VSLIEFLFRAGRYGVPVAAADEEELERELADA
jgi:hypothetical protein